MNILTPTKPALKIPVFKIRASSASEILAGKIGLTDVQTAKLKELQQRKTDAANGVPKISPLTANMEKELEGLIYKKANPELPKTAKTYCEKWIKEQLYDRRKNFTSKYTDKGTQCEDGSITFAAEYYGWGDVEKNEEWFEDDYFQGTPDIITASIVRDMKNVWDCFTLPLFDDKIPNEGYETQLQVYMHLTGITEAELVYSLMSAPLNVMEREMKSLSWEQGQRGLITDDIRQTIKREMSYDDVAPELRLKAFKIDFNQLTIEELKMRVDMCREYITNVLAKKVTALN